LTNFPSRYFKSKHRFELLWSRQMKKNCLRIDGTKNNDFFYQGPFFQ
jgi:hypothetical protein